MNISMVTDREEFRSLRQRWNGLLAQSSSDTIFLRWEWLYNWWTVYGGGSSELCIVLAEDGGRLAGIAPLYIKKGRPASPREINFLGSNMVCSDYLDFILPEGEEQERLPEILSFLEKEKGLWDVMNLSGMPSGSKNMEALSSFFSGYRTVVDRRYAFCPYIRITPTWDSVYENYSTRLKNTIKRKLKKFEDRKGRFYAAGPDDDISGHFEEFLRLNLLRMDERKISSPFRDGKFLAFHRSIVDALHKDGNVELCFLRIDETVIAAIYLLYYNNRYYYYQSGLDPSWEKMSPGTLLLHYCIRRAFERGADEFDFLRGAESYKYEWTSEQRTNVKISVYGNTLGGLCSYRLGSAVNAVKKRLSGNTRVRKLARHLNSRLSQDIN